MSGRSLAVLFLLAAACTGGKSDADDTSADADTDVDTDVDTESPSVSDVRLADCSPSVDKIDLWSVSVAVTDPQGDIASTGSTVTVLSGGETLATYALACSSDTCSGGWSETTDGIDCGVGASSTFRFVIVDDLGHESAPYDHVPE